MRTGSNHCNTLQQPAQEVIGQWRFDASLHLAGRYQNGSARAVMATVTVAHALMKTPRSNVRARVGFLNKEIRGAITGLNRGSRLCQLSLGLEANDCVW